MLKSKHIFPNVAIDPIESNVNLTLSLTRPDAKHVYLVGIRISGK